MQFSLGLDFGTESVRAIIVDIRTGQIAAVASHDYTHGVIDQHLPDSSATLPPDFALQHPADWINNSAAACRDAIAQARVTENEIVGIGIAFTSCTMLPCLSNGTPLCLVPEFASDPQSWPKLWKHHAAKSQTDRINTIAQNRKEPWLARYGGQIGLEWFFPKILEALEQSPRAYAATEIFLEAGDWFVWQFTTGPFPHCQLNNLIRSTCQAGYKACWSEKDGYPSPDFFSAVDPRLASVTREKLPGRFNAPGNRAGSLTPAAAELFGLRPGTPISTAIIDAHAGVPGTGASDPDTLVMVIGTSSCHMLNSKTYKEAPGIAGVVADGILPGYIGYETGQASVGDAFAWLSKLVNLSHKDLNTKAATLSPGSNGVLALDWLNGARTPFMDGHLTGAFIGLTLGTRPEQLYRALMEATAFGVKLIVQTLASTGIPVTRFVASGGLPAKSPLLMQIYADVLESEITLAASDQSVALGAAILGCIAVGPQITGYNSIHEVIAAMARQRTDLIYRPNENSAAAYRKLYELYLEIANPNGIATATMRKLRALSEPI